MPAAAEIFAAHALGVQWPELPEAVRRAAAMFLFDTVAVGIAGAHAPFAAAITASEIAESQGKARIFGSTIRTSLRAAAFINAYQIHAQEYDCVHEAAVLHPYSAIMGALSAECTANPGTSGARFGAALVAGVDIAVSLGLAATSPISFFRPASAGIFGATVALACLREFTHAQTVAAIGHALAFASGTMQAHIEGTPGLALQVAAAARNALAAADLAQAGIPGATHAIDGPFGYLALFEKTHNLEPILARLGKTYAVAELSHKPFPTGRAGHGGIGAVQTLMQTYAVQPEDIVSLRYVAPSLIMRLVGRAVQNNMRVAYARLCLPYLAARTLYYGTVGLDAFSTEALAEQRVLDLARKITVEVNDNPDPAAFTPATLHAHLKDQRHISIDVPVLLGSPQFPLDLPAQLRKAQDCLTFAGHQINVNILKERADQLAQETDMDAFFALGHAG